MKTKKTIATAISVLLLSLSSLSLSGCGEDLFSYADEVNYKSNVVTNGIVGIDLLTGAKTSTDINVADSSNTGASIFSIKEGAKHGSTIIDGSKLIYEPEYNFRGEDVVKVEQGQEEDTDYKIIAITFLVGQGLEAPVISGVPTTQVGTNQRYYFKPTVAANPDKTLSFSIANKPSWLSFSTVDGTLSGTAPKFEEKYYDVTISVTDGTRGSSMEPFDIIVVNEGNSSL